MYTSVRDVDLLILDYLDDDSLIAVCLVDKYMYSLLSNEILWRRKVEKSYPQFLNDQKNGQTWQDFYKFLYYDRWKEKIEEKYPEFVNGRERGESWQRFYEILSTLSNTHDTISSQAIIDQKRFRIMEGYVDFLLNDELIYSIFTRDYPASSGSIEWLDWMEQHRLPPPTQFGINKAAGNGHIHVLNWSEKRNLFPDQEGANKAAENGHTDVLKWMRERNLPLPDHNGLGKAGSNGHSNVIKWVKENRYPPSGQILPELLNLTYAQRCRNK